MNRLIAFGCSNTFGHGLEDCWDYDKKDVGEHPSKIAWPQLVADKLGLECHNQALPGASNKMIMNLVMNFPFAPKDTVIIMWTFSDRYHVFSDPKRIVENHNEETIGPWLKSRKAVTYYRQIYNENDQKIMTNHYVNYTSLYLEKHKITHLQTTCSYYLIHPLVYDINYSDIGEEYPKAIDNIHIGPEAHNEIANRIYKRISS
jgi:hypothetical protein